MEHIAVKHENCNISACGICDGGLFICKNCGLLEGSLTTDCPNITISEFNSDLIYNGFLDFKDRDWIIGGKNPFNKQRDKWGERGEFHDMSSL